LVAVASATAAFWAVSRREEPAGLTARPIRVLPPDTVIAGNVEDEHRVGEYLIQLVRDTLEGDRIVDIRLRNHRVFAVRAPDARLEHVGEDLTGDRVRDVVVLLHTGGAHCCTNGVVLSLGRDSLRRAGIVAGGDGEIQFEDVDGDGTFEVRVQDWRFAYWRDYAFNETAAPYVLYRYTSDGYQPACDLMREPAPTRGVLETHARELSAGWTQGDPPSDVYEYLLELIYAGNAEQAWMFFDLVWPSSNPGKEEYRRDLRNQLRGSPCWSPPPPEAVGS
jgi:hypothetical protein